MNYQIGEVIKTKKKHACKNDEWIVLSTGVSIKIKCIRCGREIIMFKYELDKKVKK